MTQGIGLASRSWPRLGTILAVLGLFCAVAVGALNFLITHVLIQTIPIAVGAGCIIWLCAAERHSNAIQPYPRTTWIDDSRNFSTAAMSVVTILFNIGVGILVLVAILNGGRGLEFYILASSCGFLLLIEIVFANDDDLWPALVLAQILVFAFVVRFAALVMTPSWIGIDIWIHMPEYVERIIATHSLAPLDNSKYAVAPLYHLLVSATAILGGVSARAGLFLSVGVAMPLSVLCIYTAALYLLNVRWALFATAVYGMCDFVIVWGLHLIPTSLGLIFFLMCVSLLIRQMCVPYSPTTRIISMIILFLVAITFTHQVSAFIMVVFLSTGVLVQFILTKRLFVRFQDQALTASDSADTVTNLKGYAAFAVGLVVCNWAITPWQGDEFLQTVLSLLINSIAGSGLGSRGDAAAGSGSSGSWITTVIPYINYIGLVLLLFATVLATLYIFDRWSHSQPHMTLLLASIIMLFFTLVPPLFGLRTFLPGRWFAFLYIPLALLTAIGFSNIRSDLSPRLFVAIFFVFLLVFPSSMIFTTDATLDQPAFDDQTPKSAHTMTELSAMDTVHEITEEDAVIYTDSVFGSNANHYTDSDKFTRLFVTSDSDTQAEIAEDADWRMYREYQTTGAPVWNDPGSPDTHNRQLTHDTVCDRPADHIAYSNGDVELCGLST